MEFPDAAPVGQVTRLLVAWGHGDRDALDELLPFVHAELHRLAARHLDAEARRHSLQPADLVNEVFLRLVGQRGQHYESEAHFFAIAARLMRQILVDHARTRLAAKRGGAMRRVSLEGVSELVDRTTVSHLRVNEALAGLASINQRRATVAELRVFGGLNLREAGRALGISTATAARDWRFARAWLARQLAS
jgi:RNA polymerase sigma-70 factor (ECF subfamily)